MILCYLLAILPLLIGAGLWIISRKVVWQEWLIGSAIAFLTVGIFHFTAIRGMTADKEMRSGYVTNVSHHPRWIEEWVETHTETYTDSDGDLQTRTWTTIEYDTHYEHWQAHVTYGSQQDEYGISQTEYNFLKEKFGGVIYESGKQPTNHGGSRDSGDNNIYTTDRKTEYLCPANKFTSFENRIKAAPSVFSYSVPPENSGVFDYPGDIGWKKSDRLKGDAKKRIGQYEWDCLNAKLGPIVRVNLILVGFTSSDSALGQMQEAKWIGGKKNDLVLVYGIQGNKVIWSYVFGWTEREIVKRNLETLLLENPIDSSILPVIEKEVRANYRLKDWSKFDYISVEPPVWSYLVLGGIMALTQSAFWIFSYFNVHEKE